MRTRRWPSGWPLLLGFVVLAAWLASARPAAPEAVPTLEARGPHEIAFRSVFADSVRLHRMAGRVLRAGAALCEEGGRASAGLAFATVHDFPRAWQKVARAAAGLGDRPRLLFVVPGSPADRAGLAAGDEIHAIEGRRVPSGPGATRATARLLQTRLLKAVANDPFTVTVHGSAMRTVSIRPDRVCDDRIVLGEEEEADATGDGERIVLSRGMMRLAASDYELAWIVAHQLAHNVLHRLPRRRAPAPADGLVGVMEGAFAAAQGTGAGSADGAPAGRLVQTAYSREFEEEADYAALYILARADLLHRATPELAWRLASALPRSAELFRDHPVWPERFAAMRETIAEIEARITAGLALEPDFEPAAAKSAGRERQRALDRQQTTAVLAGAGKFMNNFGTESVRVSIKGPRDVAIWLSQGFSEGPEYLAGALCASIKEAGSLLAGPMRITVGDAGGNEDGDRFPCQ